MPGFRHILFPVDFSDRSKAVCSYVKDFAHQFHAKLTLLNVVAMPVSMPTGVDPSFPVMFDFGALEPQVRESMKHYCDAPDVERVVRLGDPAMEIADFTSQSDVDLVMLPTHGYGKFRSLLLGSVTSKVLHDCNCAVWTAPHGEVSVGQHWPCRNILVAVDRGAAQAAVLRQAAELASELKANIRLVHAVPGAGHQPGEVGGDEFAHFLMQMAGEDMAKLQLAAGTDFEASVIGGAIGPVVQQVAEEHRTDLVVIGRGLMHERLGRLRSNSYDIIRRSPCPVLSL